MKKRKPLMINGELHKKFKTKVSSMGLTIVLVTEWLVKAWLRGDIKHEIKYKK